jgi:hypothetical protein
MASIPIKQQLFDQIDRLDPQQIQRVLEYTLSLQSTQAQGIRGEDLIALAHEINFPAEDLAEIMAAIEEDCERIDPDGW